MTSSTATCSHDPETATNGWFNCLLSIKQDIITSQVTASCALDSKVRHLFLDCGSWHDILCFSNEYRTVSGLNEMKSFIAKNLSQVQRIQLQGEHPTSRREIQSVSGNDRSVLLTENLGKIYLDFQRHVVRGIIDQKDKIR
jgi:hypothetical protein